MKVVRLSPLNNYSNYYKQFCLFYPSVFDFVSAHARQIKHLQSLMVRGSRFGLRSNNPFLDVQLPFVLRVDEDGMKKSGFKPRGAKMACLTMPIGRDEIESILTYLSAVVYLVRIDLLLEYN